MVLSALVAANSVDNSSMSEVTTVEPVVGLQSLSIFTPRFRILLALIPLTIGKTYEISTD